MENSSTMIKVCVQNDFLNWLVSSSPLSSQNGGEWWRSEVLSAPSCASCLASRWSSQEDRRVLFLPKNPAGGVEHRR